MFCELYSHTEKMDSRNAETRISHCHCKHNIYLCYFVWKLQNTENPHLILESLQTPHNKQTTTNKLTLSLAVEVEGALSDGFACVFLKQQIKK